MFSTNLSTTQKMSSSRAGVESILFDDNNFERHSSSPSWQNLSDNLADSFSMPNNVSRNAQNAEINNMSLMSHDLAQSVENINTSVRSRKKALNKSAKEKASFKESRVDLEKSEYVSSLNLALAPATRANALLADIAVCKRNIAFIESAFAEECANLRLQAEKRASKDKDLLAELENTLQEFVQAHKTELFGSKKTLNLNFGTLSFRESTRVVPIDGWSWEGVLACLENSGMHNMIRQKREVDKLALKSLTKNSLKNFGCESQVYESFSYQV